LLPLALPNELFLQGNPFLGLFCLSFLFWALYESPSFKFAALLGMIFGLISTVLASYWMKNFNEYAIYTLGGTTLGYIGYNALLAAIIHGFSKIRPGLRPFIIAAIFAVYEYLKSTGFLAYPYGLVAYPVHMILPFIQFVDITGLWGLSFLCSYFNAVIAESFYLRYTFSTARLALLLHKRSVNVRYKSLFALALVGIAFTYGSLRLAIGFPAQKSIDVLLIQQNINPWDPGKALAGLAAARDLTRKGIEESLHKKGRAPDLVVWNETALRYPVDVNLAHPFREMPPYMDTFPTLFEDFQTNTLTGAPVFAPISRRYYNAAILVTKDGRVPQFYGKQHPVPFVESIPFMEIGFIRAFFEGELGITNVWLMGNKSSVFTLPLKNGTTVGFGVPICFEDVFPDICREFIRNNASFLINISNDSWSDTKSALYQHIGAARFRAIETRKPLLRSCNAGLTCIVDPSGAILSSIPLFEAGYLLAEAPLAGSSLVTLYTLFGDYFPYLLTLFLLALLFDNVFGARLRCFLKSRFNFPRRKTTREKNEKD
jgi:apolipoprotein N-acyltransferase